MILSYSALLLVSGAGERRNEPKETPAPDHRHIAEGMFIHEWEAMEHFHPSIADKLETRTDFQKGLPAFIINLQLSLRAIRPKFRNIPVHSI